MTFDDWKSGFLDQAHAQGFDRDFLAGIAPSLTHLAAPQAADAAQPEARKTLRQYLAVAASQTRIDNGQAVLKSQAATFDQIEQTYGVDRHVVAAIWGMETNYGTIRGDLNVLSCLASLSHAGRRRPLFEAQLLAAFKIVQHGTVAPADLIGSWAGAIGHTQFMPTSYLDFAVSLNGGTPNIWVDDPGDALGPPPITSFATDGILMTHGACRRISRRAQTCISCAIWVRQIWRNGRAWGFYRSH